ncbi:DUF4105 domain-containing protein [Flavobacterium sp.]|uniref:lipoprotein N-acyltransferase Lnb domain-containing protein n=1 Tax=Flavobacterium sp. TaxID=239 RepID=UPI003D137E25
MTKRILLLLLCITSFSSFSQIPNLSDNAIFSVLTVDVSNESHTLYGHTALRVKDSLAGFDVVYNYGTFDFRTPNFLLKFTKGDLQYYASVYPFADFEYSYHQENRSIYEQKLNLTAKEKHALFEKLNQSAFTDERFYTYKFIDRNCTTKVIDVINSVLIDHSIQNHLHKNESYREVLYNYQTQQYWLNLGINIIFGHRPDEQASVLFLPLDLMKVLETVQHNGKPLAEKPKDIFIAFQPEREFSFWNSCYPLVIVLTLVVLIHKRAITLSYLAILGLIGLVFIAVSLYSEHKEVLWNYNMLLFNPMYLLLTYFILKNNTKWVKKVTLISLVCLCAYTIYMFSKAHLLLIIPILVANFIILIRIYLSEKIKLSN